MSLSYREPLSETVGKRMVVTGPDYIKDHLPKIHQHTAYIGEKRPALEKTGDLRYLLRSAPDRSLPAKYKHEYVGGIGWGIPEYSFINRSRLGSGFHIKLGELSLYANDKVTHRYQNPWQPKPSVLDMQGENSRAFLAWSMSDYEDSQQRDSQRAILVKQSKSPRPSLPSRLPKLPKKEEKGARAFDHELNLEIEQRELVGQREGDWEGKANGAGLSSGEVLQYGCTLE
ncbi:uncharacterized protein C4orf45 homolog [Chionomys nivalis]|uniref:uncharacterized protein C4orf45 homolog n=1 Tax=Chionomys nivalis TaxID=269649 RepID=UPI002595CC71|nr:uncharacterized protein C4orf45 homolog [Chionomys nivalis]